MRIDRKDYEKAIPILMKEIELLKKTIADMGSSGDSNTGGAVSSVNGKTGAVVLNASDVGALPKTTEIPTVPTNVSAFENDAGYLTIDNETELLNMLKPHILAEMKYTFLNYIESNGTQHINTGFTPNQNTRIVMDFHATTASTLALFGARTDTSVNAFTMWLLPSSANPQYGSVTHTSNPISINPLARLIYDMNKNVVKVGSKSVTFTKTTFSAGCPLMLFALNKAGTVDDRKVSGKMYSCKIYNNDTLIRDFVPARSNINGDVGLYDRVNDKFYKNAGTGAFTAG